MDLPHSEGVVLPEWIDANGHMNLAYYIVLFDQATDLTYDVLGVGQAYREATGNSTFTAETHTLYERELRAGERVRVVPHLLGVDAKRMHYFHEMFHAESGHRVAGASGAAYRHVDPARGAVSRRAVWTAAGRCPGSR
jgi:acyl-CoA thioester hydrolase